MTRKRQTNESKPLNTGKQGGLAALLVIFVVALVSLLVTGLFTLHNTDIRRTGNILGQDQASMYSLAAETFAMVILKDDWIKDKEEGAFVDHELDLADEAWGQYAIQVPIDTNVGIQGQIDDMSAKFNINSIVKNNGDSSTPDKAAIARLKRLLSNLAEVNPDLSAEKFVDWIDRDDQVYEIKGAEDETYQLYDPPYRAANDYFNDISELWLIDGMTAASFNELRELLTVLPNSDARININTAKPEVFRAYILDLSAEEANAIVQAREEEQGFKKMDDFLQLDALAGKKNLPKKEFRLTTNYFQILVNSMFNDRVVRLLSTVYRDDDGNLSILKRDFASRESITKQVYIPE